MTDVIVSFLKKKLPERKDEFALIYKKCNKFIAEWSYLLIFNSNMQGKKYTISLLLLLFL